MACPKGTVKPQYVARDTFVVVVGMVKRKPLTVTAEAVKAVLVPAYVKLDVENACELVVMELAPAVSVATACSRSVVVELPAFVVVANWFVAPVS